MKIYIILLYKIIITFDYSSTRNKQKHLKTLNNKSDKAIRFSQIKSKSYSACIGNTN